MTTTFFKSSLTLNWDIIQFNLEWSAIGHDPLMASWLYFDIDHLKLGVLQRRRNSLEETNFISFT